MRGIANQHQEERKREGGVFEAGRDGDGRMAKQLRTLVTQHWRQQHVTAARVLVCIAGKGD